jgi:hypothetical protein
MGVVITVPLRAPQGTIWWKLRSGGVEVDLITRKHDLTHWDCGYAVLRRAVDKSI